MDGIIEMNGLIYGILAGALSVIFPSLVFYVFKAFKTFVDKFV